jgi:hypothetical protein
VSGGIIYGYVSRDYLLLNKEIKVEKKFILVDKAENVNLTTNGVIGLGIDGLYPNFVEELYQQMKITASRFSIFLNEKESRLLLGDYSQTPVLANTYRQMTYCSSHKDWSCETSKFEVGKKNTQLESFVKFDTSVQYLTIPISDYKIFKKYILEPVNADCQVQNNRLSCKCDKPSKFSQFSLFINNSPIVINTEKLIEYYPNLDYQCVFEIYIDNNNLDTWILGTNVSEEIFLSFDTIGKKIGFVQDPVGIKNLLLKEEIFENLGTESPSDKILWLFAMVFVMLCMYGLIRFANGDRLKFFERSESHDFKIDKYKLELIQHKFNSEEYDYDKNFKTEVKAKEEQQK